MIFSITKLLTTSCSEVKLHKCLCCIVDDFCFLVYFVISQLGPCTSAVEPELPSLLLAVAGRFVAHCRSALEVNTEKCYAVLERE